VLLLYTRSGDLKRRDQIYEASIAQSLATAPA
jgi:hypothetical protein